MKSSDPRQFKASAEAALDNLPLQTALARAKSGFIEKRRKAIHMVDDFELLKQKAQTAKQEALNRLPELLARFEANLTAAGGVVHHAATPADMNRIVLEICAQHNAKTVTKGKSMVSEETRLNHALEAAGLNVVETDLGEYIIQLADEPPSHIIAPAVHKTRQEVEALFHRHHLLGDRSLDSIAALVAEARTILRRQFLAADVGITGANLLVADTGSIALVTNEGNGDLTATLPAMHIVTTSIEKVVANLTDAGAILDVLARSATGQAMSTYTTFLTGPRRNNDLDGPSAMHVILLDNGRRALLQSAYAEMLRCIRCGACLNHCPVYGNVGGHAYGSVYPGPMGAVLTPLMLGMDAGHVLPNASTFCGRCEEVCPMGIPLTGLMRKLRHEEHALKLDSPIWSLGLRFYCWLSLHPRLFHWILNCGNRLLFWFQTRIKLQLLPFFASWTRQRELPAPATRDSFIQQWKNREKRSNR